MDEVPSVTLALFQMWIVGASVLVIVTMYALEKFSIEMVSI
ncbi:hypothetical protein MNBD_ALPHA06-430, partial [hydrothermal vent metagenome]